MAKYTPMVEQYLKIKADHQDTILFFRLGDFYEMFFEDAKTASRELEIVLTARDGGESKIPMCGVPYHSADNYIARLISRGYKVAICEQTEDPSTAKGIVKREVIRIITPGTVLEDIMLEENKNNYLAAVIETQNLIGFSYIDISTGDFWVTEINGADAMAKLESELHRLCPAECLVPEWSNLATVWQNSNRILNNISITNISEVDSSCSRAENVLLKHFGVASLDGFGLKGFGCGIDAAAAIIVYLNKTQKTSLKHIRSLKTYRIDKYLEMDYTTRKNLELTAAIRDGKRDGSLLCILDTCSTAMGKRMIKNWIEQPLRDINTINLRLDAVEELKNNLGLREELKELLSQVYDLERLAGKIGSGIANPRDLLALKKSAYNLKHLKLLLNECRSSLLAAIRQMDSLDDIYNLIHYSIDDEAPLTIKEGNIIKTGYSKEIDELKELAQKGTTWLLDFENREKERTGIKNLKVGFNKVFGYYIEITKSNLHLVPPEYHRKQTLVNNERFICEELKNYEEKILGARERLFNLEYAEFIKIRDELSKHIGRIQETARMVAIADVLYSLAQTAYHNDYVRPKVDNSGIIRIKAGRHPVVEKSLKDSRFVPNDIVLGKSEQSFALITGPNMGGKSTFMRQTALLVLMAQIGSFVPAEEALIGVVDKIFTRVGASDDLAAGQSTFMVEMVEVANIINNATGNSLVILDEIGRGTSTYDGLSIARAVSEFIVSEIGCKTLFATHYHELTSLADEYNGVFNLSVSVKESGDNVVFLKKVLPGKADKSYGLHVARLAGLPAKVNDRAAQILAGLEKQEVNHPQVDVVQMNLFSDDNPVIEELQSLNPDDLTPREALMVLYRLKEMI